MSAGSGLYGICKPKTAKKEISSSTTLAFTSQLSSLLSSTTSSTRTSSGRPRPSSTKPDIFSAHNKNTKKRALRDVEADDDVRAQTGRQDLGGVDPEVLHRSKRKMEEKARLYAAMKRGDYIAGEGEPEALIDFDRKWAENEARGGAGNELDTSSDGGLDSEDGGGEELVEFTDEFGRARHGTRRDAERTERKARNWLLGAEELERMSARPTMPSQLIYGDTVQTAAFNPDETTAAQMEEVARKRDRSPTPPEAKHYEADKEIRSKGVGFYSFSKHEALRMKEMEALEAERRETERIKAEREERKERKRMEIEKRKKEIGMKRAKKQADSFLEGLTAQLARGDEDAK
jgi:hypothetical protein